MRLYQRAASVKIASERSLSGFTDAATGNAVETFAQKTIEITGLRIQFSAKKSLGKEPNTLDLKITNLSERTRSSLQKVGSLITLAAGYGDSAGVIFQGDARTIDHLRTGPDWVTHIQCGDGERAYQFARFSESFKPGTSIAAVARACARAMGVNVGNLEDALAGPFKGNLTQFAHGYTAHGKASAEFDRLMRTCGFHWSIQNGAIQVLKNDAAAKGTALLLTPDTGLVGSPDHGTPEKKGGPSTLKVVSLLQPSARCGGLVDVRAAGVKGLFRIDKLEHSGDTAGGEWYTKIEARPAT